MKRFILSAVLVLLLTVLFSSVAYAGETKEKNCLSIEYLENGDYIVTEFVVDLSGRSSPSGTLSTINGAKTASYYNSNHTKIWSVTVNGSFSYTYGVSATATSASAAVNIHVTGATYISKSSSTSGNTATATGTVRYDGTNTSKSVSVSCDKYGNMY